MKWSEVDWWVKLIDDWRSLLSECSECWKLQRTLSYRGSGPFYGSPDKILIRFISFSMISVIFLVVFWKMYVCFSRKTTIFVEFLSFFQHQFWGVRMGFFVPPLLNSSTIVKRTSIDLTWAKNCVPAPKGAMDNCSELTTPTFTPKTKRPYLPWKGPFRAKC